MSKSFSTTFYVDFEVQRDPYRNNQINGIKAKSLTQAYPANPSGIVIRYVFEIDEEALLPTVNVTVSGRDIKQTIDGLMQIEKDLS